ncbi:MAG: sel1 repeat family protein [Deltaproteobacteria bacterium]|nr:sel1 repeat family protein [Deltaproteobacteria bacterium]
MKVTRGTAVLVALVAFGAMGCGPPPEPRQPGGEETVDAETAALDLACADGKVAACVEAGERHGRREPSPDGLVRMAASYYRACRGGHDEACVRLAEAFLGGKLAPPRGRRFGHLLGYVCGSEGPADGAACMAAALFGRACGGGAAEGCVGLAALIESGRLGKRPLAQVHGLLDHACAGGHGASCLDIGRRYRDGSGGAPKDASAALTRLEAGCRLAVPVDPGADSGAHSEAMGDASAEACADLGDLVARGQGTEPDLGRAAILFHKGCEAGAGQACTALGWATRWGRGVAADVPGALAHFQRGCELGDAPACAAAGRATEKGIGTAPEPADAYDLYRRAVDLNREACERGGNQAACTALGGLLREGRGTAQEPVRGLELQRAACQAGHASGCIAWATRGPKMVLRGEDLGVADVIEKGCVGGNGAACLMLARIGSIPFLQAGRPAPEVDAFARGCEAGDGACCNGLGIRTFPLDDAGRRALERACKLGDAPGCYHLSLAVGLPGSGQDTAYSIQLLEQACAWRHGPACGRLALRLSRGLDAPLDMSRAKGLFDAGCRYRDGLSCHELGVLLQDGMRVTPDPARGQRLLERACRLGEPQACTRLGHRQLIGRGVPKDILAGSSKLDRACRAGYGRACLDFAAILREGRGVPVDLTRAARLVRHGVPAALAACQASLSVCYDGEPATEVMWGWGRWAGAPARLLVQHPSCDVRLERACRDAVEALATRCDLVGQGCFTGAALHRRLGEVGLETGEVDAAKLDQAGLSAAQRGCAKKDAAACVRLADAYTKGLGTRPNPQAADRYRARACQLDAQRCSN